jgi:hypothetical protein
VTKIIIFSNFDSLKMDLSFHQQPMSPLLLGIFDSLKMDLTASLMFVDLYILFDKKINKVTVRYFRV